MKSVIVFGRGGLFREYQDYIYTNYNVVAIADNRTLPDCIAPKDISKYQFDAVLVCVRDFVPVVNQLLREYRGGVLFDFSIACASWKFDKLMLDEQGRIVAIKDGISAYMETLNDVSTFYTVLVQKEYDIKLPQKAVVIDAGLNIGFASLFFARQEEIQRVYAYEPFKTTLNKALLNLKLNSADKVETNCAALSNKTGTMTIETISLDSKGSNTLISHDRFDLPRYEEGEELVHNVEIAVLDAASEVRRIRAKHPDCGVILKMDVEGSEYDIVESLAGEGGAELRAIDAIVMEIHTIQGKRIKEDMIDILLQHGFCVYNGSEAQEFETYGTGYLIATRSN